MGDSAVQRVAEPLMVEAVAKVIGVPLTKKRLPLASGVQCEVDGVSANGKVLVHHLATSARSRSRSPLLRRIMCA